MPLTEIEVRRAKPGEKPYKLHDSGGLFLLVSTTGAKSWRQKIRPHGREKLLTHGLYPAVSLAKAREFRDRAKLDMREGRDPALEKRKARLGASATAGETFKTTALAWWTREAPGWSDEHAGNVKRSLERDVFPYIGHLPLAEINTPMVLDVLRRVEHRGAKETARRLRQRISAVFGRGQAEGKVDRDPAPTQVTKAMAALPRAGKRAALTELDHLRQLMHDVEASGATPIVKLASRLLALTHVRPGVLIATPWDGEFEGLDGPEPLWRIPPARMKLTREKKEQEEFEHLVPLSPAAVDVLQTAQRLTGALPFIFPNGHDHRRHLSESALTRAYKREGYQGLHVPHGWRAAYSTIMNERASATGRHGDRAAIDLHLAHVPKDKVEAAYNRAQHLPRRRELVEEWADLLLDGLPPASALLEPSAP